ncbi:MAG: HEAT repeat domain-containing protein [Planctomycetota bacterium]
MRASCFVISCLLPLAACAGGGPGRDSAPIVRIDDVGAGRLWVTLWPELLDPAAADKPLPVGGFPVRPLARDQLDRLKRAEHLWRSKDPAFDAQAERLMHDPVTSFWLARLFVNDLLFATDRGSSGVSSLVGDAPWQRPLQALVAMGAEAAPCVVLDLLRFPRADRRDLGARVLAAMGSEALDSWKRVLGVDDARGRRAAVDAVAGTGQGEAQLALLNAALEDADLGVRAQALRGLGKQGAPGSAILRRRVRDEADPFLRVAAIDGLGHLDDRESAEELVQQLDAALSRSDSDAVAACQVALIQRSGIRRPGTVRSWREWLKSLQIP